MLGTHPGDRLYQPGLNILKMWPMPNVAGTITGRNYEIHPAGREASLATSPRSASTISRSRSLRVSSSTRARSSGSRSFSGTIPGWNDSKMVHPRIGTDAVSVNYSLNPTTFLEGTFGRAGNQLAACGHAELLQPDGGADIRISN